MTFVNDRFPVGISYGSSGGPGFKTEIVQTDSGREQRVAHWADPLYQYNAKNGVKSWQDLADLKAHFLARHGARDSFPFKDWTDFNTTLDGRSRDDAGVSTVTATDQALGVGDGIKTTFQLVKTYTRPVGAYSRVITRPVVSTIVVAVNGSPTTAFTVDAATGVVTFSSAPANGAVLTWGGEFDVPVRYGEENDQLLSISIDDYGYGSLEDVILLEVRDDRPAVDDFPYGGAYEAVMAKSVAITLANGRMQVFQPTASGLYAALPNPTDIPDGAIHLVLINSAASLSFDLKDHAGMTLATLTHGTSVLVCMSVDGSGNRIWYAI